MTDGRAPSGQALVSDHASFAVDGPSGFDPSRLRAEPDPERLSCWCGGWGHFFNTAFDPPQLTFCGNCEDANKPDPFAGLGELEQDLMLARLGDYPGPIGCKRIAAAYDALAAALETVADVWTLPAVENPWGEKWHCQHHENVYAASKLARDAIAIATEARRAETVKQGSVHEGAGRVSGIAQPSSGDTSNE